MSISPNGKPGSNLRGAGALKKEKKALEIIVASIWKTIYSAVVPVRYKI
jgi:hypothetical protein